jgi:hypothetical protein
MLLEVFPRCLRGWHLGRNLDQSLTLVALERALVVAVPEIHPSDDFADATRQLTRFLDNVQRIHSALGYLTPREFEESWRVERHRATMPLTGAEDRATVGTDPSVDSGVNTAGGGTMPPASFGIGTKALNPPLAPTATGPAPVMP